MEQTFGRRGTDRLASHLEAVYGTDVAQMRQLDVGVFRADRHDGPSWVARVFPAARPLEATDGDAEILQHLAQHGSPAERVACPEPVSTHEGQGVVVTEHLSGHALQPSATSFRFGSNRRHGPLRVQEAS